MQKGLCNLKKVFRLIYHFENEVKNKTGNSINELLILCSLQTNKTNPGILAEEMGITAGRISKIISTLEKNGMVRRELNSEDKRQMFFSITPKGIKKLKEFQNFKIYIPNFEIMEKGEYNE